MLGLQIIRVAKAKFSQQIGIGRQQSETVVIELRDRCDCLHIDQSIGPLGVAGDGQIANGLIFKFELRQAGRHVTQLHLGQNTLVVHLVLSGEQVGGQGDNLLPLLFVHIGLDCRQALGLLLLSPGREFAVRGQGQRNPVRIVQQQALG